MSLSSFLSSFNSNTDSSETLISICFIEKSGQEILNYIHELLEKIQKVSNSMKRKKLNDTLYPLVCSFKNKDPEMIFSSLYFLDGNIHEFTFNKQEVNIAKEYKLINPYYKTGETFQLEYFQDFFLNQDFQIMVEIQKSKMSILKFTKTKETSWTKDSKEPEKYLEELKTKYHKVHIIGYKSDTFCPSWLIVMQKALSKDAFYEWKKTQEQLKHHQILEKRLQDLQNSKTNLDLYVFGKLKMEILQSIENFQLKELYIQDTKLEKLKSIVDHETLNFTIIPIFSIEKGDIADRFIQDYNGLMGIRYYA